MMFGLTTRRQCLDAIAAVAFIALFQALSSPPENLRSRLLEETYHDHAVDFSNLRFLTFGTSRAWGAGLSDRRDAYPFLLSKNVTNLAIRAAGCEYPSLCTMSMVGDAIYDVILIEYNHVVLDKHNYQMLARRLRHRFPEAKIVFLYAWSPFQYSREGASAFDVRRDLYPESQGLKRQLKTMWSDVARNSTDWKVSEDARNKIIIYETAQLVGGYVWELPQLEDPTENLEKFGPLFLADCTHYSSEGHMFIKDGITKLLRDLNPTRHDTLQPWDSWDRCESWYESGNTMMSSNMSMVEFRDHKHALEAPGWIEFDLDRPALLSINHMAGGPNQIYPRTEVRVGDKHLDVAPLVRTNIQGKTAVHIVQTLEFGRLEPGTIRLHLLPMEERQNPFRAVGIILINPTMHSKAEMTESNSPTNEADLVSNARVLASLPRSPSDLAANNLVTSHEKLRIWQTSPPFNPSEQSLPIVKLKVDSNPYEHEQLPEAEMKVDLDRHETQLFLIDDSRKSEVHDTRPRRMMENDSALAESPQPMIEIEVDSTPQENQQGEEAKTHFPPSDEPIIIEAKVGAEYERLTPVIEAKTNESTPQDPLPFIEPKVDSTPPGVPISPWMEAKVEDMPAQEATIVMDENVANTETSQIDAMPPHEPLPSIEPKLDIALPKHTSSPWLEAKVEDVPAQESTIVMDENVANTEASQIDETTPGERLPLIEPKLDSGSSHPPSSPWLEAKEEDMPAQVSSIVTNENVVDTGTSPHHEPHLLIHSKMKRTTERPPSSPLPESNVEDVPPQEPTIVMEVKVLSPET